MTSEIEGQLSIFDIFDQDIWSGKMCQEPSVQTKAKISEPSSKKQQGSCKKMPLFLDLRGGSGDRQELSWETDGVSLGEYTMRSFGEYPNEERESLLSQILEVQPHQKYCLSAKACQGILRRAEKRGKVLPPMLEQALRRQAGLEQSVFKSEEENRGGGKGILIQDEHVGALSTLNNQSVCVENHPNDSRVKIREDGKCQTLSGRMGTGGGNVPMVMYPEKTTGSLMASGYDKLGTQEAMNDMFVVESSAWDGSQVSPTLTANNAGGSQRMPDKDNFNAVIQSINGDIAGTLDASYYKGCGERQGVEREVVAYGLDRASFNQGINAQYDFAVDEEKIGTQVAKGPGAVCNNYVVRRLTPMECERLQGFPDGWTDIGDWIDSKGKKHKGDSDSPRYKALGNSIALPFWEWMAKKMCSYLENPTMASLFDGIGGFPLVYSRVGCKPVWASEIEEFPIAVTKKMFGEE